jgi:hypothetical protein
MPEMPSVSTRAECARVKSRPDVYGGPAPSRDVPSPEMCRNVSATTKVSTAKVSTTKVSTTKVSATMTTAMTTAMSATMSATMSAAAVSRRSIGGQR